MKIVEYSKGSITEIENVFKVVESGAQGPPGEDGEKGDTGQGVATGGTTGQQLAKIDNTDFNTEWVDPPSGGGINYDSPIAVNTTSTITPVGGDYFVSTAKVLNISGTAGEVFEPALAGETSRRIWGLGSGLDLININVNTSGLGIGEQFAIEADNGESRRWILNSIGDLVKVGGVIIPLECQAYHTGAAQITVLHNTITTISTLGSTVDNSGQMHQTTGNGGIKPIRSGQYESHNRLGWTGVTSGTTHNVFNRMYNVATLVSDVNNFILSDDSMAVFTRASPPFVALVAGTLYELKALQLDKGGTSSIKVHSSASGQEQRNFMHLKEVDPY